MALTTAETQRRYREKREANPIRRNEYLLKSKSKYAKDKLEGKRVLIANMSERSKRTERKKWRLQKTALRLKQKQALSAMTPPCSPLNDLIFNHACHASIHK